MKRGIVFFLILGGLITLNLGYCLRIENSPDFSNNTIFAGEERAFYVLASGSNLSYVWKENNNIVSRNSSYVFRSLEGGSYIIEVIVGDGKNITSKQWNVRVLEQDYPEAEERSYVKEWYWQFLTIAFVVLILAVFIIFLIEILKRRLEKS